MLELRFSSPSAERACALLDPLLHPRELRAARNRGEERDAQREHHSDEESPAHRTSVSGSIAIGP
jgi:hypothetical protein